MNMHSLKAFYPKSAAHHKQVEHVLLIVETHGCAREKDLGPQHWRNSVCNCKAWKVTAFQPDSSQTSARTTGTMVISSV